MDWTLLPGRELRVPVPEPWHPQRVVAVVNIWDDRPALEVTAPEWMPYVDVVLLLDGRYGGWPSTDGLAEWVAARQGFGPEIVHLPDAWADQNQKRSAAFAWEGARAGDLFVIIDADEHVHNAASLREPCPGDVGWVRVQNPIYKRTQAQPRIIRWQPGIRYRGRHHWLYCGDRVLATHQYGGAGWRHYVGELYYFNDRGLGRTPDRNVARNDIIGAQAALEADSVALSVGSDRQAVGREPLRVIQTCYYDPGLVAFRLHTGLNATTPNQSALIRTCKPDGNPFDGPTQVEWTGGPMPHVMQQLFESADVAHCHLNYNLLDEAIARGWRVPSDVVIHHHGSMLRAGKAFYDFHDAHRAALRLVSNFDLLQWAPDAQWLPNPVPTAYYAQLRAATPAARNRPLMIGHSPSKRELKGTDIFLAVVERLQKEGVRCEALLIEKISHEQAIRMKAKCDLFFDSFWLGIQCSGIEAGAMSIPVVAGDPYVRDQYVQHIGRCPYVFAEGEEELFEELRKLCQQEAYRQSWAALTHDYVVQYHDEAAVALRYLDLLDAAIGWRRKLALVTPEGLPQMVPA